MRDVQIAPSMLAADFTRLGEELASIGSADLLHFDVMDGHFVPNISFGPDVLRQVCAVSKLPVDCHLMISDPDTQATRYVDAGADLVSFHIEATPHAHRVIASIHDKGARAGIAICPATPVSSLEAIIDQVELILVMSVNPGFGGQSFIPSSLRKIEQVRALCQERGVRPLVEVDGGIGMACAREVCAAGADVLVAGSSVFGCDDRQQAIADLRELGTRGLAEGGRA